MKIYVASSWRHPRQPEVVTALQAAGHDVYDFRNPPNGTGFSWKQIINTDCEQWTLGDYLWALDTERAEQGYRADMDALTECDACVMLPGTTPGRSMHLELGYAVGAGKRTVILLLGKLSDPELMYKMASYIALSIEEMILAVSAGQVLNEKGGAHRVIDPVTPGPTISSTPEDLDALFPQVIAP